MITGAMSECLVNIGKNELLTYNNSTFLYTDSPVKIKTGDKYTIREIGNMTGKVYLCEEKNDNQNNLLLIFPLIAIIMAILFFAIMMKSSS